MAPKKFGMTRRESDARRASASLPKPAADRFGPKTVNGVKYVWNPVRQQYVQASSGSAKANLGSVGLGKNSGVAKMRITPTEAKDFSPSALRKSVPFALRNQPVLPIAEAENLIRGRGDWTDAASIGLSLVPFAGKPARIALKGAKAVTRPGVAYASTPGTLGKTAAQVNAEMKAAAKARTAGEKATIKAGEAKSKTAETATQLEKQSAKDAASKSVNSGNQSTVINLPPAPAGAKMPVGMSPSAVSKFGKGRSKALGAGGKQGRTPTEQARVAADMQDTIKSQLAMARSGGRAGGDIPGEYGNLRVGGSAADSGLAAKTKAPKEMPATPSQAVRETSASGRAKAMFEPKRSDYAKKPSARSSQAVKDAYAADMKRYEADIASWKRNQGMADRAGKPVKPNKIGEENPISATYGYRGSNLARLQAKGRDLKRPSGTNAAAPEAPAATKPASKPKTPSASKPAGKAPLPPKPAPGASKTRRFNANEVFGAEVVGTKTYGEAYKAFRAGGYGVEDASRSAAEVVFAGRPKFSGSPLKPSAPSKELVRVSSPEKSVPLKGRVIGTTKFPPAGNGPIPIRTSSAGKEIARTPKSTELVSTRPLSPRPKGNGSIFNKKQKAALAFTGAAGVGIAASNKNASNQAARDAAASATPPTTATQAKTDARHPSPDVWLDKYGRQISEAEFTRRKNWWAKAKTMDEAAFKKAYQAEGARRKKYVSGAGAKKFGAAASTKTMNKDVPRGVPVSTWNKLSESEKTRFTFKYGNKPLKAAVDWLNNKQNANR